MTKYRYEELTWPEVKTAVAEQKVVLIPVGTIEQHGPHLPLAVDVITSSTVCERAAAAVPELALVMPPISYAFNEHHMDFPGTIAVDAHHFIDYVTDVGTSVARHGFRKIVLVNGHGSNVPFLDICARLDHELHRRHLRDGAVVGRRAEARSGSACASPSSRAASPTPARSRPRCCSTCGRTSSI